MKTPRTNRGIGLVDTLVGVGIMAIVFVGIFGVFRLGLEMIANAKVKAGAIALANERMEFIRSLEYDEIGTEGGVPAGDIPQTESVSLNGVDYTRRVFIQYKDAPQDGTGSNDENSVTSDYKVAKVEVKWQREGRDKEVSVVSNIAPPGIETTSGGGTLRITAFDAKGVVVPDAEVHIENQTTTSTIDVTTYTNADGRASFPGAPESGGYEVTVTKSGFSTDKTYDATSQNPNPNPAHLSVVENTVTSSSFQIDQVSELRLRTLEPAEEIVFSDTFLDDSKISEFAQTRISSGDVVLYGSATSGEAYSMDISDPYLGEWREVSGSHTVPASSTVRYHVYYTDSGSRTLVPDVVLPGNSTGFATSSIDLSGVATSSYSQLQVGVAMERDAGANSPQIHDWQVTYEQRPEPIPSTPLSLRGSKTIGTTADGDPVYKYWNSMQTNSDGERVVSDLEWDTYSAIIPTSATGNQILRACPPIPLSLAPGTSTTQRLILTPYSAHSLRVSVTDDSNAPIVDADVRLKRSGVDIVQSTGSCGQTLFSGLDSGTQSGNDRYMVQVSDVSYNNSTINDVTVQGTSTLNVVLTSP